MARSTVATGFTVQEEIAGQIRHERDHDPGGFLRAEPVHSLPFHQVDTLRLPLDSSNAIAVRSGDLGLGQIPSGGAISSGVSQRLVDEDGVRRVGAARHGYDDEAAIRRRRGSTGRVRHGEHVEYWHRSHQRRDHLTHTGHLGIRQIHAWCSLCTRMIILRNTEHDDAAGRVGERSHVTSQCTLLRVAPTVQRCLEVQVERLLYSGSHEAVHVRSG